MPTIDRTQLIIRETNVRMTPPPTGRQFRDALVQSGRAVLEGAVNAASYLPGGPLVAAAVRGAVLPALQPLVQGRAASSAELPNGSTSSSLGVTRNAGSGVGGSMGGTVVVGAGGAMAGGALPIDPTTSTGTGGTGSVGGSGTVNANDDMLARGQEMSMQMLRLQEAMGEENRRYTALSNVLHARHEMAKNAIGNIR
jgi:hypothetical protein